MNDSEVLIPVAYCGTCKETGPVIIKSIKGADIELDFHLDTELVMCPQCESFLNLEESISIQYYNAEDLEKVTGWRVADGNGDTRA